VARVIRSPRAKRDIVEVIEYTKERCGKAQARAYGQLICLSW
jgi:plasmid stabilization system protein ParE